jgi:hypothetical protein
MAQSNGATLQCSSTLPAGFAQTFEHVGVVVWSMPRNAPTNKCVE